MKVYAIYVLDGRTLLAYVAYMESHRTIIAQRGGIRPLARKLGHRNHTTVQGWWERDRIPDGEQLDAVMAIDADQPKAAAA